VAQARKYGLLRLSAALRILSSAQLIDEVYVRLFNADDFHDSKTVPHMDGRSHRLLYRQNTILIRARRLPWIPFRAQMHCGSRVFNRPASSSRGILGEEQASDSQCGRPLRALRKAIATAAVRRIATRSPAMAQTDEISS
jgi:hypothetical protein